MKNALPLALIFIITATFGQTLPNFGRVPGVTVGSAAIPVDTTLRVIYVTKTGDEKLPALYVNGRLVNRMFHLDPKLIESLDVDTSSFQIGGVKYYGRLRITTKISYNSKFISLNEVKEKYTNLNGEPVIFMVDGEIITSNNDEYLVDENLLWRIFIDKIEDGRGENLDLNLIKLLTKSDENLKKLPEIRIRGTEVGLIK